MILWSDMVKSKTSAVIPAYNEAASIRNVIAECKRFCDEIIVVDDGSTDNTAEAAESSGAVVIRHEKNLGVTRTIESGFNAAQGDIIVTIDADGQHSPLDIPKLIEPISKGKADVVFGVRALTPHLSERIINKLTNLRVKCSDVGTGFRAIKAEFTKKMRLHGACPCGTFVLEAHKQGARITEILIEVKPRLHGNRKVSTKHFKQFFYVLKDLF